MRELSDTARSSSAPTISSRRGLSSERRSRLRALRQILSDTWHDGNSDEIPLFAPAIAYALVISLAPLTFALRFLSTDIVRTDAFIPGAPLGNTKLTAEKVLGNAYDWAGPVAIVITVLLVAWGASSLFTQFVRAIHRIWGDGMVGGVGGFLGSRALAILLLVVMAAALFTSAVFGAAVDGVAAFVRESGGLVADELGWVVTLASSRVVLDFVFAAALCVVAFTAVPEGDQRIRDVLPGVILTAAGYALGQQLLGLYLTSSQKLDVLGSFGVFVALLIWAYYTALILLWGAELTRQIARRRFARRKLTPDTSSTAVVQ